MKSRVGRPRKHSETVRFEGLAHRCSPNPGAVAGSWGEKSLRISLWSQNLYHLRLAELLFADVGQDISPELVANPKCITQALKDRDRVSRRKDKNSEP